MRRPAVIVCGPSLAAISGVTTHVGSLLASRLGERFSLVHFQVGSEGRSESPLALALRLILGPFSLANAIVEQQALIVHLNTSLNARAWWRDLALAAAAKLAGARVVLQKHGGQLERFAGNRAFAPLVRLLLRLPDAIVVLSRAELAAWQAFVPGQRIALLPNAIDAGLYLKQDRGISETKLLKAVYVGRLARGKGLDEALDALSLTAARVHLTIAGSGPEEARLKKRVRGHRLTGHVTFAGPVFGEEKARLLAASDVLLLPSYSEGLPYALLEAMAAGAVPVATPVGAIPDVVIEGVHGRFVALQDAHAIADALAALDADRAALARMSEACRRRIAAGYSLGRLADDFERLYCALIPWPASQAG